jgi:hypothetical protein
MSDFKKVHTGKNGDTWEHTPTGLARYFDRREMEYSSSSDNDSEDGMKGPGYNGFTGKMTYRSWSESEVKADFLKEQADAGKDWFQPKWKPYEMVYHVGYREYQVKWKS